MEQTPNRSKLESLEKKINEIKSNRTNNGVKPYKVQNDGWRMVIELVVGMLIGVMMGLALDFFLDTKPLFLIIFTLLGFVAGVKTMMNTAKNIKQETIESK